MKSILHIYTRVSSTVQEDQGSSLDSQLQAGIRKSCDLGFDYQVWNVGGKSSKYEDLNNRPVLRKLMVEIDDGNVQHLFVYNTDRLSRNQRTWGGIRWKLKEHKVKLHTTSGVIDLSSPLDELVIGILSEISQYDNALRSERSQLGKIAKVKMGFWMGGPPPYGYKIHERKLVENPDEGVWIRKMFQLSSTGLSAQSIKSVLDENGVETRRRKGSWSTGSIQKILRNGQYIGSYTYHDKKLDETVQCTCPPLVSQALWNSVQDRRKGILERKGQNSRTKKFYLLRNLMRCGHCSRPFGGKINSKRNIQLYYCPHKERTWPNDPPKDEDKWVHGRGCRMSKSLNISQTDNIVWNAVQKTLSDPGHLQTLLKSKMENEGDLETRRIAEIRNKSRLENELEKAETSISDLETDHRLGQIDQSIYLRVSENLHTILRDTQTNIRQSELRLDQIKTTDMWVDAISNIKFDFDDIDQLGMLKRKDWLNQYIDEISVKYDQESKHHSLLLQMKIPLNHHQGIHAENGQNLKNQPENIFSTTPPSSGEYQGVDTKSHSNPVVSLSFALNIRSSRVFRIPCHWHSLNIQHVV